jgi:hypothetical protein
MWRLTEDIVGQAAHNNAVWCDAVCSTHSGPGEFHPSYWLNRHGVPEYYPDLVTLTGAMDIALQTEALATLIHDASGKSLSVKDSFNCLGLMDFGFTPLFEAEWLSASALGTIGLHESEDVQWVRITGDADLARWEQAWRRTADNGKSRTFRPNLLSAPHVQFVYGLIDGVPVGGGVLAAAAGVTGMSNVFASRIPTEVVLQGLARIAAARFPRLPLVGYESGDDLAAAHHVGFRTVGHLRIWRRPTLAKG